MTRGTVLWLLALVAVIGSVAYFGSNGATLDSLTGKTIKEEVTFSVIRYDGKIVSARLVIGGSGQLKANHRITKEGVGIAFYEKEKTIRQIQSCDSYRYISSSNGFVHELIKKEVELK